jgi:hypothetical protein
MASIFKCHEQRRKIFGNTARESDTERERESGKGAPGEMGKVEWCGIKFTSPFLHPSYSAFADFLRQMHFFLRTCSLLSSLEIRSRSFKVMSRISIIHGDS